MILIQGVKVDECDEEVIMGIVSFLSLVPSREADY